MDQATNVLCIDNNDLENMKVSKYTMEEPQREFRVDRTAGMQIPNILDPDDALMKRFQDTLRAHLTRINNKLEEEIIDLEAEIKSLEKQYEEESLHLYNAQEEVVQQQSTIEKYQTMLTKLISLREEKEKQINAAKQKHKQAQQKLLEEKDKEKRLAHELDVLTNIKAQFVEWENELNSFLTISKQMSSKDLAVEKELINQKQQKDYILCKLEDEIWKIKTEIEHLDEQIQLKDKEKIATGQLVADANADLEALHKENVNSHKAWNAVVINIGKIDKVYDELSAEREKIRESFNALQTEIERIKKDTMKETERNEYLTSLQSRLEDNIRNVSRSLAIDNEKLDNHQAQLAKVTKLYEQVQSECDIAQAEYRQHQNAEEQIDKEERKLISEKNDMEKELFDQLKDKLTHDKTARYLNKLLFEAKEVSEEQELSVIQAENNYGKNLFEIEQLNTLISEDSQEVDDMIDCNKKREKEINFLDKEIDKMQSTIERQQRKVTNLNKAIEQILSSTGGEEISPLDLKIIALQGTIQEIEDKNQKSKQFWLRQQGLMVSMSQQRDSQVQELNILSKEVMIMEQKNLKLEYELEKFSKEEANMDRTLNLLQQKLTCLNAQLATQKEIKLELEDKNILTKTEYVRALEDAELELIRMQSHLKELNNEKIQLKDELCKTHQECISWQKKVQLATETCKRMKDERKTGGEIALMKNEIHKMEMRLSHLRRIQENLINDMEFCVARRDAIMDKVMGRLKRNPKEQHNQRIVFCKRLEEQKSNIKQLTKEIKQIQTKMQETENERKKILEMTDETNETLKAIRENTPEIEKQITEEEFRKCHNLKMLVYKQHKLKMLQDIKNGQYKMLSKNEVILNEELQKERNLHSYLTEVMERANEDFPHLKEHIRKILLTLQL